MLKAHLQRNQVLHSKELILNLPVFIDTAVDSLVTITGLEAQKIKHAVREFDRQLDSNILIADEIVLLILVEIFS